MFRRKVAPGIEMRHFEMCDAENVFAVVDRHREHLGQWLPWVAQTRSPEEIRQFISRALAQTETGRGPQTLIWVDEAIAGSIGCHAIDWVNRSCAVGYWLAPGYQGKGIVTRCCASLLDYLFLDLGLHRIEIRCGTGNSKSCAIPQRLGFAREGVARQAEWVSGRWVDLVVWSMLENDWHRERSRNTLEGNR